MAESPPNRPAMTKKLAFASRYETSKDMRHHCEQSLATQRRIMRQLNSVRRCDNSEDVSPGDIIRSPKIRLSDYTSIHETNIAMCRSCE